MTRDDFIAKFRHELDGIVLDACITHRTGAELSIWLRSMRGRIESRLGSMYDALIQQPKPAAPPTNGQHKPTTPATR